MNHIVRTAVLLLCIVALSGCFGQFALAQKAHELNRDAVENRWGQQAIFYAMILFPIYPVSLLFDLIVINPLETATGQNPISGEPRVGTETTSP